MNVADAKQNQVRLQLLNAGRSAHKKYFGCFGYLLHPQMRFSAGPAKPQTGIAD